MREAKGQYLVPLLHRSASLALGLVLCCLWASRGAAQDEEFRLRVRPILVEKCWPCHSREIGMPWYGKIPVPYFGNPVAEDVENGLRHFDLTTDDLVPQKDPWLGPEARLRALRSVIANDSMPPRLYLLMHPSAKLTPSEKAGVLAWTNGRLAALAKESSVRAEGATSEERVAMLFRNRCTRCHNAQLPDSDGRVYAFNDLSALRADPYLIGEVPDEGTLYETVKKGKMPPKGADEPLTRDERKLILDWVVGDDSVD